MRDDKSTQTGDNTNNSSTGNTEDTSVKKGIEQYNITTTASTKSNSIGANNEVDTTTDNGNQSTTASPNDHHIHTSNMT